MTRHARPLVRPSVRRVALWVGPLLVLVLLWQVWDRYELRMMQPYLERLRGGLSEPRVEPSSGSQSAGSGYLAAQFVRDLPATAYQILPVLRESALDGRDVPADVIAQTATIVRRNEATLRLIDEAAGLPFVQLDPWHDYVAGRMSFATLDTVASLRTLEEVVHGDSESAAASILSRIQLLRVFGARRNVLQSMFKDAAFTAIVTDLQVVLRGSRLPLDRLAQLSRALDGVYSDNELEASVRGEALGISQSVASLLEARRGGALTPLRPLLRRHLSALIRMSVDAVDAVSRPWPDRIESVSQIAPADPWLTSAVTRAVSPRHLAETYQRHTVRFARSVALLNAARIAVQVEQQRRARDVLPELEDLGMRADAVLDPFTGRPLVLKPVAGGYLVYSVGQNRRDDGGDVRAVRPSHVAPGLAVDSLDVGVRILTSPGAFSAQE